VVITDVGPRHDLMLDARDSFTDLPPLNFRDVAEHSFGAKVVAGKQVSGEGRGVVRRQCNEVVEDASIPRSLALEVTDPFISNLAKVAVVVHTVHKLGAVIG